WFPPKCSHVLVGIIPGDRLSTRHLRAKIYTPQEQERSLALARREVASRLLVIFNPAQPEPQTAQLATYSVSSSRPNWSRYILHDSVCSSANALTGVYDIC